MGNKKRYGQYCLAFCICTFISLGYSQGRQELDQLNAQVAKAYQEGRYQDGITLAKEAYEKSISSLGEKHPSTVDSMNNLAALYQVWGQYSKAEPLYVKALQITREFLGARHPSALMSMNHLAGLYYFQGEYSKAEPLYVKTLQLRKEVLGEMHPDTLMTTNHLAGLYRSQRKYSKAETLFLKTLQLRREVLGEKHPNTFISMDGLAGLYESQGKYNKAEPLFVKTLQLRKEILGEKHPSTILSMNNMAKLYSLQGEYNKAKPLYIRNLQLRKEVSGEKHIYTLKAMHNLATLYELQGEYSKAEPLYVKALQLVKEVPGEQHRNILIFMGNLAKLYFSQGEYSKAEPLFLKALQLAREVLGEKHPNTLTSMNNLALLYESQGEYSKAEPLHVKSLQLSREVLGEHHPSTLTAMGNLAGLYRAQGEHKKAELLYLKTLQLSTKVLGKHHPNTLTSMNNLAAFYESQREYSKAEPLYLKTLNLMGEALGKKHPNTLTSTNNLVRLYNLQKDYKKALSVLKGYLVKKYLFLKTELRGNSEKTRESMLKKLNVSFDKDNLFSILEKYSKKDFDDLALYFSVNYKGILLQVSQELKQVFTDISDQELVRSLLEKRSVYSSLSLNYEKREKNESLIEKLEKEIDKLEKKLIWKNSDFKALVSDVKAEEITKALSVGELIIDFVVYQSVIKDNGKSKLSAIITGKDYIKLVNLGDFNPLLGKIKSYRDKIQNKQSTTDLSQEIYEVIFSPLEKYLRTKKKIYIVPDGVLHLLPFRSLIDGDGQYLAQSKNIIILSSSRDLVFKNTKQSKNSAIIFAYPNYGDGKGKEVVEDKIIRFSPLTETLSEAKAISSVINIPATVYTQNEATEKNISQLDSPKILHIATHGYFLDTPQEEYSETRGVTFKYKTSNPVIKLNSQPMLGFNANPDSNPLPNKKLTNPLVYSGLALAGANNPGDEGILTALEVLGLNLKGTDLVVLSACETGVGEIRQGEGVYSLQRAFQEAGAKSVLATLWKVDDKATQLFMEKFYNRYMQGMSAQRAVRDTQLDFINSKRYSHPYYWSSFVMIGGRSNDLDQLELQTEKVANAKKIDYKWIISVVAILGVILVITMLVLAHRKKEKRLQEEKIARRKKRRETRK